MYRTCESGESYVVLLYTMCALSLKACSNRHKTWMEVVWHESEAAICGSSIFKNAVWPFYILFICGLASFKESKQTHLPISSLRRLLLPNGEEEEILSAAQCSVRLHTVSRWLFYCNKERSYEASEDIMIFYLVRSYNGYRTGNQHSVLLCKRIYCKKRISMFILAGDHTLFF